jgi:NitT/TauT family transport system substrate-binding protein
MVPPNQIQWEEMIMGKLIRCVLAPVAALLLTAGLAVAKDGQPHVTIAVGGAGCLCYLPTVLAQQLGEYDKAGVDIELINFKGGSQALTAVLGGSADVVSGYFDHCVNLAAKNQALQAFVVYDRYPGLTLLVSPKHADEIKSIKDLAGKKVGVSAPGSSTDFFLKYLLHQNGVDPNTVAVIGIGLDQTAVAAMEQGTVDAAVMLDPAATLVQGKSANVRILSDTRTQKDTLAVFKGEYPGGALYARADWVGKHEKETQALTNAIVVTLRWIHSHSAEDVMAKMPEDLVGPDKALYLAALKNTIPMYSTTGRMDPKGAEAVLAVFSQSVPEIAKANIDVTKTYTNKFVEQANQKTGMNQ